MYIGIDLGGTNIAAGLVSEDGKILIQDSTPTNADRNPSEIAADMAKISKEIISRYGIKESDVKAVGIGCPGSIDFDKGMVVYSNNIKFDHFPLTDEFRKHLDLPVYVDNDANCAAMGEYVATGERCDNFLFVTLGTGVGGGIVLNGKVLRGFNGAGGEIGHMTLVSGGEKCSCGKAGCWEAYASVTALIRQTKAAMESNPQSLMNEYAKRDGKVSGRTAFDAARAGDEAAKAVVKQYAIYVADGIVSMENIFQPNIIAIGGGISREGDYLLDPIKEYVEKNRYNRYMEKTKIVTAKLFNDAGIIGAANIAAV